MNNSDINQNQENNLNGFKICCYNNIKYELSDDLEDKSSSDNSFDKFIMEKKLHNNNLSNFDIEQEIYSKKNEKTKNNISPHILSTQTLYELSISLLRDDFIRFCGQHSWYKHNKFYGDTFYFYLEKGQQKRNFFIESDVDDTNGLHWHWTRSKPEFDIKYGEVKFGPFLRGDTRGFDIIKSDYPKEFKKLIDSEYPFYNKNIDSE